MGDDRGAEGAGHLLPAICSDDVFCSRECIDRVIGFWWLGFARP